MAGDWIKMRVWLARDPRVISMADHLACNRPFMNWLTDPVQRTCNNSAHEHVTRNVIVALCVTGLLVTWGSAREQGDRDGEDLVLRHTDLSTIDAMTDIPGFGDAMAFVEWATEEETGSVRFPKFFRENESPEDRHRRQAADRQARHRERKSLKGDADGHVTSDVTVTHREEERREEVKTPPSPPSGKTNGNGAHRPTRRQGTIAPNEFEITEQMWSWATEQGIHHDRVEPETAKFLDHHKTKASKFSDWHAAWRNWMRKAVEFSQERRH